MENIKTKFEDKVETMVDKTMYYQLIESVDVRLERELGRKLDFNRRFFNRLNINYGKYTK